METKIVGFLYTHTSVCVHAVLKLVLDRGRIEQMEVRVDKVILCIGMFH